MHRHILNGKNFMSLIVGFVCLTKSLEIIKTDNRSFCCCNSLPFYFCDHIKIDNFLMLRKRATSYGCFNRKMVCKKKFFLYISRYFSERRSIGSTAKDHYGVGCLRMCILISNFKNYSKTQITKGSQSFLIWAIWVIKTLKTIGTLRYAQCT